MNNHKKFSSSHRILKVEREMKDVEQVAESLNNNLGYYDGDNETESW